MGTRYVGTPGAIGDFTIRQSVVRLDEAIGRVEDSLSRVVQNNVFQEIDAPGEEGTSLKVNGHLRLRDNKFLYWAPKGVNDVAHRSAGIRWHVKGVSPDRMEFDVGTSTKMVLNANGQVGIGTVTPITTGATMLLDVRGQVAINTTAVHSSGSHVLTIGSQTGKTSLLLLPTDSGGETNIQAWGNTSGSTAIAWGSSRPGAGLTNDSVFSSFSSPTWTERARIVTATGNLLVGSSTDQGGGTSGRLQVTSGANQYTMMLMGGSAGTGGPGMQIYKDTTAAIAASIGLFAPADATHTAINDLTFGTLAAATWSERMRLVNATGDVLIGTTTDSARLTVTGAANASAVAITGGAISSGSANVVSIAGGTVTGSSAPSLLSMTQTWDTSGGPKAILVNITDTAMDKNNMRFAEFQFNGTRRMSLGRGYSQMGNPLFQAVIPFSSEFASIDNHTGVFDGTIGDNTPRSYAGTASGSQEIHFTSATISGHNTNATSVLNVSVMKVGIDLDGRATYNGYTSQTSNSTGTPPASGGSNQGWTDPAGDGISYHFGAFSDPNGNDWDLQDGYPHYLAQFTGDQFSAGGGVTSPRIAMFEVSVVCDLDHGTIDDFYGFLSKPILMTTATRIHPATFGGTSFTGGYAEVVTQDVFASDSASNGYIFSPSVTSAYGSRQAGFSYDPSATELVWDIGATEELRLSATALKPNANAGLGLGENGKGWGDLWLKDTSASFELRVITTNTGISADRTLTIDLGNASRTLNLIPSAAYTISNGTTDRTYDANATTIDELADIIYTMWFDLNAKGILG